MIWSAKMWCCERIFDLDIFCVLVKVVFSSEYPLFVQSDQCSCERSPCLIYTPVKFLDLSSPCILDFWE